VLNTSLLTNKSGAIVTLISAVIMIPDFIIKVGAAIWGFPTLKGKGIDLFINRAKSISPLPLRLTK
jgi:hypothetical protein